MPADSYASPLTRRRFTSLLLAAPLALANSHTIFAAVSNDPGASPTKDDPLPASLHHDQAITLLRRGLSFERAAAHLESAARKEPENPAHRLALGCALADRAVSVAYAAAFTRNLAGARAEYARDLKEWEQQVYESRIKSPDGKPDPELESQRPVEPKDRSFVTKDDSIPFALDFAGLMSKLNDLCERALAAWDAGITLAKTPEEKAQAYYIQGWGIRLLVSYLAASGNMSDFGDTAGESGAGGVTKSVPLYTVQKLPAIEKAGLAFDKAIEAEPDNPLYWQAKGDFLHNASASLEGDAQNEMSARARDAYRKAADLGPDNSAALWYRLYQMYARRGYDMPAGDIEIAQFYLEKAQARDRGNSWPVYEEASLLFRRAPFAMAGPDEARDAPPAEKKAHRDAVRTVDARQKGRRAIDRIVQGNAIPRYVSPRYAESVPVLMAIPWHYSDSIKGYYTDFSDYSRLRELARSVSGYMTFITENYNDFSEAMRAGSASVGMGKKLVADWPRNDGARSGRTIIDVLVGAAVVAISYRVMQKVCDMTGSTDTGASVKADSDDFQQKLKEYKTWVLNRSLTDFDLY